MRELSLFTGAGGGLLGTRLLGWEPIGYVEIDEYCQRVIAQRIADGILPRAPIFTDVRKFVQSGAAREYRGFAEVVTAGFPCQPFSFAGKRAGADDERNMWPATLAAISAVRPRFCLLENVPGLVTSGYFGAILGGLAESGYDCRWRILSAAELGAPHKRDRLWIVGYAAGHDAGQSHISKENSKRPDSQSIGPRLRHESSRPGEDVTDTNSRNGDGRAERQQRGTGRADMVGQKRAVDKVANTQSQRCERSPDTAEQARWPGPESVTWWEVEPDVGRLADGFPDRVAQLRAAGNAQVASVVAAAWRLLTEDLRDGGGV